MILREIEVKGCIYIKHRVRTRRSDDRKLYNYVPVLILNTEMDNVDPLR